MNRDASIVNVEKVSVNNFRVSYDFKLFISTPVQHWEKTCDISVINNDLTVPNVSCTHVSCTPTACLPITVASSLNTQAASRLYL